MGYKNLLYCLELPLFGGFGGVVIDRPGKAYKALYGSSLKDKHVIIPRTFAEEFGLDGNSIPFAFEFLRRVSVMEMDQAVGSYVRRHTEDDMRGLSRELGGHYYGKLDNGALSIVPDDFLKGYTALMKFLDCLMGARFKDDKPPEIGDVRYFYPERYCPEGGVGVVQYPFKAWSPAERAFWSWVQGAASGFYETEVMAHVEHEKPFHTSTGQVMVTVHPRNVWERKMGEEEFYLDLL